MDRRGSPESSTLQGLRAILKPTREAGLSQVLAGSTATSHTGMTPQEGLQHSKDTARRALLPAPDPPGLSQRLECIPKQQATSARKQPLPEPTRFDAGWASAQRGRNITGENE